MKKLLTIGVSSLAVLPVLAVVSCSTAVEVKEINLDFNKQETFTKSFVESVITAFNKESATEAEKIEAIKPLFSNSDALTKEVFETFTVKTSPSGEAIPKITLTANDGHEFKGAKKEMVVAPKEIKLTPKTNLTQEIINAAITAYEKATTDSERIVALQTLVDEIIDADILAQFTVKGEAGVITLTATAGNVFSDGGITLIFKINVK